MMNAALVLAFDAPPRYMPFTDPTVAEGEVIVNVTAAGLHPIVKSLAAGTHYGSTGELPFIPGVDGVGRLADGTRVYFGISRPPFGAFAERVPAKRGMCLALPSGLGDTAVAAMMNPGMSSWAALKVRAGIVGGENVLILGATGVAGQLAVQITKRSGARRVIAAGRNLEALERLKELGADTIISLDQAHESLVAAFRREWTEQGIEIVLDYLWGQPAEAVLEALTQKGLQHAASRVQFIQVGSTAGTTISLPAAALRSSGLELLGSGFGSVSIEQIMQSIGEFLKEAAREPFQINVRSAPLRDVETLWHSAEPGTRLVFQP
jgi:NADPH:quinone reductase-like Zn-dependent oxidoreductase